LVGADSLQVVTRQDENRVLLIGSLDFERVCDLVFGANLGNGDASWAVLCFDPSPPDLLFLCGSWIGKLAKVCVQKLVSRSPVPMNATSHCRCFSTNNSIARTKVSMLAGNTGISRRFGSRDWTVVSLVSCRLLLPHVPCPVPRPVNI